MHFRIRIAMQVFLNCYKYYFNQSSYDKYAEIQNSDIEILKQVVYGMFELLWDRKLYISAEEIVILALIFFIISVSFQGHLLPWLSHIPLRVI